MNELDNLAARLASLVKEAEEQKLPLQNLPGWLKEWESPWKGKQNGGQLTAQGEEELYELGIRTRERFPNLFDEDYHPNVYPIKSSQVSCISHFFFSLFINTFYYKLLPSPALFVETFSSLLPSYN